MAKLMKKEINSMQEKARQWLRDHWGERAARVTSNREDNHVLDMADFATAELEDAQAHVEQLYRDNREQAAELERARQRPDAMFDNLNELKKSGAEPAAPEAPAPAPLDLEAKALAALGEQHNADAAGYLLIARFAAEFAAAQLAGLTAELEQVKAECDLARKARDYFANELRKVQAKRAETALSEKGKK